VKPRKATDGWIDVDPAGAFFVFRESAPMRIPLSAGLAALLLSGSALAQQPLAFPMRSQSAGQQSMDSAACYGWANQHTKIVMARQSQEPVRPVAAKHVAIHPVAVADPLPPSLPAATASDPADPTLVAVSLSARPPVAAMPAKGEPGMPALPPPESPMVQYWQAYAGCMTDHGYMVR
jgi:hypothetical protein